MVYSGSHSSNGGVAVGGNFSPLDANDNNASVVSCDSCGGLHRDTSHLWQLQPPDGDQLRQQLLLQLRSSSGGMSTRRKLLCLLFIASLALMSMLLLGEQLIERHLARQQRQQGRQQGAADVIELDIITLDQWAKREKKPELLPKLRDDNEENLELRSAVNGMRIVEDGIFWSSELEALIPPGPDDQQVQDQVQRLRSGRVAEAGAPDWLHCGRDPNRLVRFADGGRACARNRENLPGAGAGASQAGARFVQGEVMAFYLARLLGMTNVPAVALSLVGK